MYVNCSQKLDEKWIESHMHFSFIKLKNSYVNLVYSMLLDQHIWLPQIPPEVTLHQECCRFVLWGCGNHFFGWGGGPREHRACSLWGCIYTEVDKSSQGFTFDFLFWIDITVLDLEQQETPGFGNENKSIDLIYQQVKLWAHTNYLYFGHNHCPFPAGV